MNLGTPICRMNLPAKLKLVALCAYNNTALISVIAFKGAYFVDVYKLYTTDLQLRVDEL